MKAIKTIYNNCGWFLLVLIFGNILLNFFAPNSLIGQENINLVCLFLKIKSNLSNCTSLFYDHVYDKIGCNIL